VAFGPCTVSGHGTIWNPSTGHGEIDSFDIGEPCPVSVGGIGGPQICTIEEASSNVETPWTVTVEANTRVAIHGANFFDELNEGCPLGTVAGASGTATGIFANGTSSLGFAEAGDLETPEGNPVTLDGSVKLTAAGGAVTLH
jgi:hypothetical protein